LVEVKRSGDTRLRREVVGQMLDYAANAILYWPADTIRARFEERCARDGDDPADALREALGDEVDDEEFWQEAKTNLQAGRIRLVFVTDEVPMELLRIVEFLNRQMDPAQVLAVEIRQYVNQSLRTLVPRVMGLTSKEGGRSSARRAWDRDSFLEVLRGNLPIGQVTAIEDVTKATETIASDPGYGRGQTGSISPKSPSASIRSSSTEPTMPRQPTNPVSSIACALS
jgi:hypothetical protein